MTGERAAKRRRQALIEKMKAGAATPADDEVEEIWLDAMRMARLAWAKDRIEALKRAQKAVFDAWDARLAPYDDLDEDEEMPELPDPPEQAVLDAVLAEIHAVTEQDRWPRHLHWSL